MLATATTEVAAKRGKREFLSVSLKRSRGGVILRAKCAPELEQFMADQSIAGTELTEPQTIGSTRNGWQSCRYYQVPQALIRARLTDDAGSVCATLDGVGSDIGRPDDPYNAPINLSWLRAVGLKDGIELEFPAVWTADLARQYVNLTGQAIKRFYRDRLQPYDVTFVITVEEL